MFEFDLANIHTICSPTGNRCYKFKKYSSSSLFSTNAIFKNTENGRLVFGKIIRNPGINETMNWTRLQHTNVMLLLDIITVEDDISVFIMPFANTTLHEVMSNNKFMERSDSFNMKISYTEDILWGLEYIHYKKFCLMNLNEKNIWICNATNKALIGDFSCLMPNSYYAAESFQIDGFYVPPELQRSSTLKLFNATSAEMWIFGAIILKLFFYNSWIKYFSNILPGENTINHILFLKNSLTFESLKLEHKACCFMENIGKLLFQFLSRILVLYPEYRYSAKEAVMDSFLNYAKYNLTTEDNLFGTACDTCPVLEKNQMTAPNNNEIHCIRKNISVKCNNSPKCTQRLKQYLKVFKRKIAYNCLNHISSIAIPTDVNNKITSLQNFDTCHRSSKESSINLFRDTTSVRLRTRCAFTSDKNEISKTCFKPAFAVSEKNVPLKPKLEYKEEFGLSSISTNIIQQMRKFNETNRQHTYDLAVKGTLNLTRNYLETNSDSNAIFYNPHKMKNLFPSNIIFMTYFLPGREVKTIYIKNLSKNPNGIFVKNKELNSHIIRRDKNNIKSLKFSKLTIPPLKYVSCIKLKTEICQRFLQHLTLSIQKDAIYMHDPNICNSWITVDHDKNRDKEKISEKLKICYSNVSNNKGIVSKHKIPVNQQSCNNNFLMKNKKMFLKRNGPDEINETFLLKTLCESKQGKYMTYTKKHMIDIGKNCTELCKSNIFNENGICKIPNELANQNIRKSNNTFLRSHVINYQIADCSVVKLDNSVKQYSSKYDKNFGCNPNLVVNSNLSEICLHDNESSFSSFPNKNSMGQDEYNKTKKSSYLNIYPSDPNASNIFDSMDTGKNYIYAGKNIITSLNQMSEGFQKLDSMNSKFIKVDNIKQNKTKFSKGWRTGQSFSGENKFDQWCQQRHKTCSSPRV